MADAVSGFEEGLVSNYETHGAQAAQALPKVETIGVLGLGYVGVPLMLTTSGMNIPTIGFDVIEDRVSDLTEGRSYLKTIPDSVIANATEKDTFSATSDFSRLAECDAVLICVPTPISRNREPDLLYVEEAAKTIAKHLRKGQLIVLESTTYPGTTEELLQPLLESTGLKCGEDFYLAYSPEREDPGNTKFNTQTIPKVVGGVNPQSTQLAVQTYSRFIENVVPVSSTRVAEAVKIFENTFRGVNIGLVNELKMVFDSMGINMWEVVKAAETKPFGFMAFYPGPGWGGHCIPVDPFYLTWKAREYGRSSTFIEHAGNINNQMVDYIVEKTAHAIDTVHARGMRGAKVLIIGVAYKANVDDARESPAIPIIKALEARKSLVSYHDPMIDHLDEHGVGPMDSVPLSKETISKFDIALICADHASVDWDMLVENCAVVVDTRNATKNVTKNRERIFFA
ncbi:MAG: nucleotide sugar dehydrogenase [Pseudomonadota bacterium]